MDWTRRIRNRAAAGLARLLVGLVGVTSRVRIGGGGDLDAARAAGIPVIHVFWHRHLFYLTFHFRRTGARPLISLSQDGELIARVARSFGMNPVRGSSSRGGARALLELLRSTGPGTGPVLITADGPKGPPREIKAGTIDLARRSGAVIVPVSWYSTRVKVFSRSWDRFLLPLPFGRISLRYGPARRILPGDDPAQAGLEVGRILDQLEKTAMDDCQAALE